MCPDPQRLQAYFDGELGPSESAPLEHHLAACPACTAELARLRALRQSLRAQFAAVRAPQPLQARILQALDAESPAAAPTRSRSVRTRPFWAGVLSGVAGSAVLAVLAFLLVAPRAGVLDQLVTAHVNSLRNGHLIGVVSTDRHTVKPWFAGRTDVSPVVADFADQGYRLLGGRADPIARQRAAVVVYQHGAHLINVFSWKQPGAAPADTTRSGYHLAFWRSGDLMYCAVSDTGWSELQGLERLLQAAADREQAP
ncbi:MAG: anti-sigma factor [Proteobacteria bacterium]|nr:anti-sigma factor [Pseudomonadota bacterium]